jgi:hypothetical protein
MPIKTEVYVTRFDTNKLAEPIPVGYDRQEILEARKKDIVCNLLRYVAEFRLGVKFDEFFYREEEHALTGERYLAAHEPGPVINIFRRAITEREAMGLSTRREIAETEGFGKLQEGFLAYPTDAFFPFSEIEDAGPLFIWISPPGTKEEGYGAYSFTFIGQLLQDHQTKTRKVRVIPYRNIFSLAEHRICLDNFISNTSFYQTDTDFLKKPVLFLPKPGSLETPEDILRVIGEQEKINTSWLPRLAKLLDPFIQGYLSLLNSGASDDELRIARDGIENIVLAYKEEILYGLQIDTIDKPLFTLTKDARDVLHIWGEKPPPPTTGGSCPPKEDVSNRGLATLMEYQSLLNGEGFPCPSCGKARIKGDTCWRCGITKEKWAEKTGIVCG